MFVGSDVTAVSVPIDPGAPLRIHARWHSHGQGHILVNGTLRRYDPALAAGASFTIDRLAFGHHLDLPLPNASLGGHFILGHFGRIGVHRLWWRQSGHFEEVSTHSDQAKAATRTATS